MPRDTHGDLHLDHIYYFPDKKPPSDLVIIDCIEFNERFRFTDPVADMAFTVMDLTFHGRRDLAHAFADSYFRAAGDAEGRELLPLYTAYRAMIRGSVEGILLTEKEVPETERVTALQRAKAHWLLALVELEEPARKPCLLLIAGLPGTGKSTLAQTLASSAGFTVLRSDVVRKELAGLSREQPKFSLSRELLYSRKSTERTYKECLRQAEQLLSEGARVLVDATFRKESQRQAFLEAAVRRGVPAGLLLCRAGPETVRRRLAERRADVSDADWPIYLQLAGTWEEMGASSLRSSRAIATEGGPEQVLSQALDALREWGLCS